MKPKITPIRLRLVVLVIGLFSLLSFLAFFFQMRTLQLDIERSRQSRNISSVRIVELFVELSYPGDWEVAGSELLKGGARLPAGEEVVGSLSAYLRSDSEVRFVAGSPPLGIALRLPLSPPELGAEGRAFPIGRPPPTEGRAASRADRPFATARGAGVAVRDAAGEIAGWIELRTGDAESGPKGDRLGRAIFFAFAGFNLLIVSALGFLVFLLSKPIDRIAEAHALEAARSAELASISCTDHLTGLKNRRGIEALLAGGAAEGEAPSHVAILDLDHFKQINDRLGHEEGDRVLAALGELIPASVRRTDECCRWGGEEFVMLFRGESDSGAAGSAERVRAAIEAHRFGSGGFPVTATIGVAPMGEGGFAAALAAADEALYRGKREGRNRVVLAEAAG